MTPEMEEFLVYEITKIRERLGCILLALVLPFLVALILVIFGFSAGRI